jgi:phosphonate transport system permease protein
VINAIRMLPDAQIGALAASYRWLRRRRLAAALPALLILAALLGLAAWSAEIDPVKLWKRIGAFSSYFQRIFTLDNGRPTWSDPAEWYWGLARWLRALGETLVIAYVGTVLGAAGAFALSFLAAHNLMRNTMVVFAARRALEFCRTVPEIVFALIFVVAFGLGPVPGVLALAVHTLGSLGKQFAEVLENIDMKPLEGLAATGSNWMQAVRFAALPQVLANLASYTLLRFEINVREAGVMGFVGAGGIGQDLLEAVRKFYYSDVSAMLLLIVATVAAIDLLTERLRHRLTSPEGRA